MLFPAVNATPMWSLNDPELQLSYCCVFYFLVVLVCVFLKVASLRSLASAGISRKGHIKAFIQSHCELVLDMRHVSFPSMASTSLV